MQRASGVLLPIFSLPGRFSRGTLGAAAYEFVDRVAAAGFSVWQTLPITPPDGYGSPYAGRTSFAADESLVDMDALVAEGLLGREEVAKIEDHGALLSLAAERADRGTLDEYLTNNPQTAAVCRHGVRDDGELYRRAFAQYTFDRQWSALCDHAHERGVSLVGDLPIYVAPDSIDAALFPEAFLSTGDVAGVPPDDFCPDGQVWGNPLYDWGRMAEDGYAFFRARLAYLLARFDGVRLDHFRGFSAYYRIPSGAPATAGRWETGPGSGLFSSLAGLLGGRLVIAEDLGCIDGAVDDLRREFGFLSTRVLQFGFLGDPGSPHLPHVIGEDTAFYTGTHDNDTLCGFLGAMPEAERAHLLSYCGAKDADDGMNSAVRALLASRARLAILPVQDILGIGSEGRINTPGRAEGNWSWRLTEEELVGIDWERFRGYNEEFGRSS